MYMKWWKWIIIVAIISVSFIIFILTLGVSGVIAGFFETFLIISLTNPFETMKFFSWFLTLFRKFWFWAEKKKVALSIQGDLGIGSQEINQEGQMLLPHGVKIKWVDSKDRDSFLKDNKIIVCLEPSYNHARNLSRSTLLYVKEDLIRDSRRFIDNHLMKATDFVISKKMLLANKNQDALRYLHEEFILPETNHNPILKTHISDLEDIDNDGLFTRILLIEYSKLGIKNSSRISNPMSEKNSLEFKEMVKKLIKKERGVDVNPTYNGDMIKACIMPIARSEVAFDTTPYINHAKKCTNRTISMLYIVARGYNNILLARLVVKEIEDKKLYKKEFDWIYKIENRRTKAYVAVLV